MPELDGNLTPPESLPLSILALDDDADFRAYLHSLLETDGHEVRTASTPEEFYAQIESATPDVALLDMKMGRYTGEEVLGEIRRRWPRLCVIVVTGYPSLDDMRATFKKDVFDYLAKPFSQAEMRHVLAQATAAFGLGRRPQDRLRSGLGRQIRLARTHRGWTLRDLSENTGVSISQLSSIERGTHLPSLESLLAVATALGARPSEWFAEAGF
jgi:CheY-like chemotaxis protein/lambda repressor-like predicted transcriptional regulator